MTIGIKVTNRMATVAIAHELHYESEQRFRTYEWFVESIRKYIVSYGVSLLEQHEKEYKAQLKTAQKIVTSYFKK